MIMTNCCVLSFSPHFTSTLILESLGVSREAIMEDYLKTNLVNLPKAIRAHDRLLPTHGKEMAEAAYKAYIADESYLQAAWEAMGENYISGKLGIDMDMIRNFKTIILE